MPVPWIDFYNRKIGRSVYFGCHDLTSMFGVVRFEQHPGIAHNVIGDNWPRPEDSDDRFPEGILLGWVQFAYLKPGQTYRAPPVVLQFLDQLEARVEAHSDVRWNTHRHRRTGKRACVLANFGHEARQAVLSFVGNADGPVRVYAPFREAEAGTLPVTAPIDPRRLVIVVEC